MAAIRIATAGGLVVEMGPDELPTVAAEMASFLIEVQAPLTAWADVAAEYFRLGRHAQFEAMYHSMFTRGAFRLRAIWSPVSVPPRC